MGIKLNYKVGLHRKIFSLLIIGVLLSTFIVIGSPVLANPGHDFEIDGNTASDNTSLDDWETVITGGPPDWDGGPATLIADPHSKAETDFNIFKPSGKFGVPGDWTIQDGNVGPAQNELTNIYVYGLTPADTGDDAWMIMGMHRTKKQGTFDLDFELNQVPWDGSSGSLNRTMGDICVGFELSGNPTDPQEDLYVLILRYDPDSTGTYTDNVLRAYDSEYGAGWWVVEADYANVLDPNKVAATMNSESFEAPDWGALDSSGDNVSVVEPFFFAEAAINLTALGLDVGCPGFGSVHAKTRSSLEITSDLKDLAGPVNLEVDCYIYGYKYEDMNGNGIIDNTDNSSPLENWTINLYLDEENNTFEGTEELVASTNTTIDGYYEFRGLSDGHYHIQEVLQSGWTQSYPQPVPLGIYENVVIDIDNTEQGPKDFANWYPATKSGHKYEDMDADGSLSQDEKDNHPLEGWTIFVDYTDNGTQGTLDPWEPYAVTDNVGSFTINGIRPGIWKVMEVPQDGWTQSIPELGYYEHTFLSGDNKTTGNDFGNWAPGIKSGNKYFDKDADHSIDDDMDKPLNGWEIRAYSDNNSNHKLDQLEYDAGFVASNTTYDSGNYSLTLDPGDYIIVEVLQPNWFQSYPVGENVTDSSLNTTFETIGSKGYAITMTSRGQHSENDFGNYQAADLEVGKAGVLTYSVNVTNNGPSEAENVTVNDVLPGDLIWEITYQLPPPKDYFSINTTTNTLEATIPVMAPGAFYTVTVQATIPQEEITGALLTNHATVTSNTPDLEPGNDSAYADIGKP